MAACNVAVETMMLELIVTDMKDATGLYRVAQAITHADGASRCRVGHGWVSVESAWPAARFLAAIRQAGFTAVVWSDAQWRSNA
jgi:hypothetical protein